MPASYDRTSFLAGEWSQTAQGRFDQPAYQQSMNVCLNALPTEQGAWARRSGFMFAGTTRQGKPGRVIEFDVNDSNPISLEFTDGFLRFRDGTEIILTGAPQAVTAISGANPAVVTVTAAPSTGAAMMFSALGTNDALLQNRIFTATHDGGTTFSIADEITQTGINGSTLGTFVSGSVGQVLELTTPYASGSWASLRSVQAENQAVLLNGTAPQVLTLTSPVGATYPTFTIEPVNFIDGPYLDPFNGSICTYNAQEGNITLTFSFQAYSSSISYNLGDYVLYSGQGYQSLQNANLNETPSSSPTFWAPVNGGAPVGPNGFTSGDIGRHIRLFSEPQLWVSGTSYTASTSIVKYNAGYWQCIQSTSSVIPGTDATFWIPVTGIQYALWTWGRIISVSGTGLVSVGTVIGTLSNASNAFNGTVSQPAIDCASAAVATTTYPTFVSGAPYSAGAGVYDPTTALFYQALQSYSAWNGGNQYHFGQYVFYLGSIFEAKAFNVPLNTPPASFPQYWALTGPAQPSQNQTIWAFLAIPQPATFDIYAGGNFTSSAKAVQSVTIFPSTDVGFGLPDNTFTFNLRASNSAPSSPSSGTLLGSISGIAQFSGAVSITSSDQTDTWNYIWVEIVFSQSPYFAPNGTNTYTAICYIAQIQIFAPNVDNGSVVTIQLAGPALLYGSGAVVYTWRAGLYSNTNGWPTVGCYDSQGGRLWLAGSVANRADASQSNDIFNFAPTEEDGTVVDSDAISAVFNAKKVNTIFWMEPDAQGIVVGTDGGEFLISPLAAGTITASNIDVNPITTARCANIEPVRTEHTLVAVQLKQRKIFEYFADVFSGKYSAPNLMEKARHLTAKFVEEIRYQQEITPTIWARCGDGSLIGGGYKRDTLMTSSGPTYIGWHRHTLGSAQLVESLSMAATASGLDAPTIVANNPQANVRHVMVLADIFEETDMMTSAWLLDDSVAPTSYLVTAASVTFNGLWHLNGNTVTVFAGGLDCGDFAVSNGSITVSYGDGISEGAGGGLFTQAFVQSFPSGQMPAVIGFTYNSDGQLTRPMSPQESGARTGPALGKKRRFDQAAALIVTAVGNIMPETTKITTATGSTPGTAAGLQFGTDFTHLYPAQFRQADDVTPLAYGAAFSGVLWDSLDDTSSFDGMLCWRIVRPWPCIIAAVEPFGETQDR